MNKFHEMEVVKVTTPEYLSNDMFEEDFLKTYLALHRLQYLLGSCRLDAKNRFATPPTNGQKCYTVICILMIAVSNCAICYDYVLKIKLPILRYLGFCSLTIQYVTFVLNVINVRFFNNEQNVEFFVKMQKIDRLLKIERWKVFNEWMRNFTNLPLVLSLIIFVIIIVLGCVDQGLICLYFIGPVYSMLVLIFELTSCSSIVAYFVLRMKFINSLLQNHLAKNIIESKKKFASYAYIRYYTHKTQNYFETSETNVYLREIFKCFTMFQDLYRFQLFSFCLQSVVASLVTFEQILYSIQNNDSSVVEISTYVVFTVFDVFAALLLAIRYELFFNEVKETKRLCINIMAKHHEGPLRDKARKMLKMIEETPPRFSVYEMWEMNAATFVAMFSLITGLVVTLLQFAFL